MAKKGAQKVGKLGKSVELRFDAKTFFLAGRFEKYHWLYGLPTIEKYIRNEGGTIVDKLDANVDYLLLKEATGKSSHEKKVTQLNAKGAAIAIITPEQLRAMVTPTQDEVELLLRGGADEHLRLKGMLETAVIGPRSIDPYSPPYAISQLKLKGKDLTTIPIWCAVHMAADLRETTISRPERGSISPRFGSHKGSKFDGAKLSGFFELLDDCSCRGVDFTGSWVGGFDANTRCHADFTKSNLHHIHLTYADCSHSNFSNCSLESATFEGTKVHKANFSGANLRDLRAKGTDFTGSDFSKADLTEADLIDAKLDDCNLSGAKLHGTLMTNTSLKCANLKGADFTGTNVAMVNFDGCDLSVAKGVAIQQKRTITIGPKLKEFSALHAAASRFSTTIEIQSNDLHLRLDVELHSGKYKASWTDDLWASTLSNWETREISIADAILAAVAIWPEAQPLVHTIHVESKGTRTTKKKLLEQARAAWCEAFGIEVPSTEALKQEQADVAANKQGEQTSWIEQLNTPGGIENWNKHGFTTLKELSPFHDFDLSGKQLDGIDLGGFELNDCSFKGASLVKADLAFGTYRRIDFSKANLSQASTKCSDFEACDFSAARLSEVTFHSAHLRGAKFNKIDMQGVRFVDCDLCGAAFDGAKHLATEPEAWKGSTYDETTLFPKGFVVPASLKWGGKKGPDPRAAAAIKEIQQSGPIDVEKFMELLRVSADNDRLAKALSMLKSDRFRLFAEADSNQLIGVIKSQSDPDLVYSCRLASDGNYSCCTQKLNVCGGLRGGLCKHLLVLIIGMAKNEKLDLTTVHQWIEMSRFKKPALDKEAMSATLLKYKGAEAGEVDWRPMETVPEDFLLL